MSQICGFFPNISIIFLVFVQAWLDSFEFLRILSIQGREPRLYKRVCPSVGWSVGWWCFCSAVIDELAKYLCRVYLLVFYSNIVLLSFVGRFKRIRYSDTLEFSQTFSQLFPFFFFIQPWRVYSSHFFRGNLFDISYLFSIFIGFLLSDYSKWFPILIFF